MNGLALCAGVGGLELGLKLALGERYQTVGYVEREAYATAVLVARMEDKALDPAPVWDDLATFDCGPWRGVVDIVSGGYPCQPFSHAGKRGGADDERHLWPHVRRIVEETAPALCFFENVGGHLSLGFEEVVQDLEGLGYRVAAGLFTAAEVGAPHKRERLFVLAERVPDTGRDALREEPGRGCGGGYGSSETQPGDVGEGVADTECAGREGRRSERQLRGGVEEVQAGGRGSGTDLADRDQWGRQGQRSVGLPSAEGTGGEGAEPDGRNVRYDPDDCGYGIWPPGPSSDWSGVPPEAQPAIRGMADGAASRVDRLRAAGNGVVPLVAAHAFRNLAEKLT